MSSSYLLLIPPLLAYSSPSFNGIGFSLILLLIPYAAFLGKRFGLAGVVSIAIGALVFVVSMQLGTWGRLGGSPSVYLVALLVSAIASSDRPVADWLRWPSERGAKGLAFIAPFLLVTGIGTGWLASAQSGADFKLGISFSFAMLGYFLLFMLGARRAARWPWLLGLAFVAALTWGLAGFGLSGRSTSVIYLWVNPMQVPIVATAVVAYFAGAATMATLQGDMLKGVWKWPRLLMIALLVIWHGPQTLSSFSMAWEPRYIYVLGSYFMLPLAGLLAGILRGRQGVTFAWVATLLVSVAGWLVDVIVSDRSMGFPIGLEAPVVAAAYAWLGSRMARPQEQAAAAFRVPIFVLLLLAAASSIAGDGESTLRLALAGLMLLAGMTGAIAWWRRGQAWRTAGLDFDAEHWSAFSSLVLVLTVAATSWQEIVATVLTTSGALMQLLIGRGETVNREFLVLLLLMLIVPAVGALKDFIRLGRSVPKVLIDVRRLAALRKS